jgi:conjugal transfer pilus assembly protein TraW
LSKAFALIAGALATACAEPSAVLAKDYGKSGQTWSIAEPDLFDVIRQRLLHFQASGQMDAFKEASVARAQESVRRPTPVAGISHAYQDRLWTYDPTITISQDIRDAAGHLIATKGQKFNPLDHLSFKQDYLFIDGDSKAEVAWALKQGDQQQSKIVLVKGSPIDRMKEFKRRFFFDQAGEITGKFGIAHTPALIHQNGQSLEISEKVINRSADL